MARIRIQQTGSRIGSTKRQKATLDALGLTRLNRTVEHEETPQIMGMVRKVYHLIKVEKI